jgi:hypothetical protein
LPHHKPVSGDLTIKILCNKFGFSVSGQTGSNMRLSKTTGNGKVGTVVPVHDELKPGRSREFSGWQKLMLMIFTGLFRLGSKGNRPFKEKTSSFPHQSILFVDSWKMSRTFTRCRI